MKFQLPLILMILSFKAPRLMARGLAITILAVSIACTSAAATLEPTPAPTPTVEAASPAPTPKATSTPTSTATPTPRPVDLEPAPVDAFAVLEEFLDELGSRESATDQELAAARYLQSRFQELGYATELQTFTVEDLSLAGLGLTLDTPQQREFNALPMGNTGLGEVSGILTPVGLAMPGDLPDAGLEGRIALAKRGIITFQSKAENVFAAGAVGLVVYNNVPGAFRGVLATQPEFPVIALSRDDGEAIEALLVESEIRASIALTLENRPSRNVIAEKKGPGDAVVVLGGHTFGSVSAGSNHTCGVRTDGQGLCWGSGSSGQLGNNNTVTQLSPVFVSNFIRFASVDAGSFHTCGVTTGRDAFCWGSGARGQLGNGSTAQSNVPVLVIGALEFSSVSAGTNDGTCGAATSGAYCWGHNGNAQLGNGTTLRSAIPIRVSGSR